MSGESCPAVAFQLGTTYKKIKGKLEGLCLLWAENSSRQEVDDCV